MSLDNYFAGHASPRHLRVNSVPLKGPAPLNLIEQPVHVKRRVADQGSEREAVQQFRRADQVVGLAGRDRETDRVPQRVHDRHGPARQAQG